MPQSCEPPICSTTPPALPCAIATRVPRRGGWRFWMLLLAMGLGLAYVAFLDPMSHWSIGCSFYDVTGLYCPGCGLTRSMHALAHGHLLAAVRFNPLMVFVVPAMAIGMLLKAWSPDRWRVFLPAWVIWVIFIVILSFWIGRNIFPVLAPTPS